MSDQPKARRAKATTPKADEPVPSVQARTEDGERYYQMLQLLLPDRHAIGRLSWVLDFEGAAPNFKVVVSVALPKAMDGLKPAARATKVEMALLEALRPELARIVDLWRRAFEDEQYKDKLHQLRKLILQRQTDAATAAEYSPQAYEATVRSTAEMLTLVDALLNQP